MWSLHSSGSYCCGYLSVGIPLQYAYNVRSGLCFSHNGIICPFRLPTNVVKCVFAFTYCLVTFSIIWFVLGHIWIMKSENTFQDGQICKTTASKFIIVILFYEYVVGIWYVGSRVWNDPSILILFQNILQRRLGKLINLKYI